MAYDVKACLIGNPNTGKSTLFNYLTGMKQHTGNWSGKTVGLATGRFYYRGRCVCLVDLPGVYSLTPLSEDEAYTAEYLSNMRDEVAVVVLDATAMERSLLLALRVLYQVKQAVLCVNLMDEAERRGIRVDTKGLEEILGVRVVGTCAANGRGAEALKEAILPGGSRVQMSLKGDIASLAEDIYSKCVDNREDVLRCIDRRIDNILLSRLWGLPVMCLLFGLIFYITVVGANIPSGFLRELFVRVETYLLDASWGLSPWLRGILIEGMFRTLGWVVSVMLPPMAIFFPLFTILEDVGYLPRIAFVLDRFFKRAGAHGKMALTVCMGFGCNAVGVTAARIIDSPRERLIAIITNSLVPCNGRFPAIIMLGTILAGGSMYGIGGAGTVLICVGVSVVLSLVASLILSKTLLKGVPSSFVLELPPYRRPKVLSILYRSLLDRTAFVFARAVMVAAPAGALIWLMGNLTLGGVSIIGLIAGVLEPMARLMGLDGYILTAFFLGMPANEIVLPLIIMCYTGAGTLTEVGTASQMGSFLMANGWSVRTVVCTLIFIICHFPCSTTLLTIRKETGSIRCTCGAFLLPLVMGVLLCMAVNGILLGLGL